MNHDFDSSPKYNIHKRLKKHYAIIAPNQYPIKAKHGFKYKLPPYDQGTNANVVF